MIKQKAKIFWKRSFITELVEVFLVVEVILDKVDW